MSQIIQAQLEIEGYDATTAAQIVKTVEIQTDDVVRDYLSDIVESSAAIDRYIRARTTNVPESRKPSAQAAIKKTKPPKWAAAPSSTTRSSPVPPPQPSGPKPPIVKKASSSKPVLSTHIKQHINQPTGPYSRGGFGVPKASPLLPPAEPSQPKEPKENRQYKIDTIADLDAAIKKLDLSTNGQRTACDCMGSIHGLLEMAPNCLNCGKVVCNKEGVGNCLGCSTPLIPTKDLNEIITILNDQRDAIVSSMGKSALKAAGIDPGVKKATLAKAQDNLDRLLGYQASETLRTKIIDHAEDFETPDTGTNQWATPMEQARQLRNQQRKARKQTEILKIKKGQGKKVVSIAIRGNKIVQEVSDLIEEDAPEPEERKPNGVPEQEGERFWDAKKYGQGFVKPTYIASDAVKLKTQVSSQDVVTYSEQDTFMV